MKAKKFICENCQVEVTDSQKYCQSCGAMFDAGNDIKNIDKSALPQKNSGAFRSTANDIVVGDHIEFERDIWEGDYKRPVHAGKETIQAIVTKDSYGANKQQHTFTLELYTGGTLRIKGRNLYKYGVKRKDWKDEEVRKKIGEEKHERGAMARQAKVVRKSGYLFKTEEEAGTVHTVSQPKETNKAFESHSGDMIKKGDKVQHERFGQGVVRSVDESGVAMVAFESGDIKRLILKFAPMKKIK